MMHWWWNGDGALPWFGMVLGPLGMIVGLVTVVVLVAYLLRAFGLGGFSAPPVEKSALDILKERFARGEIDRAEYEERRRVLSAS